MPRIKCKSICNPNKPFGVVCDEKAARLSGMFCKPCQNNAVRLLSSDELTGEMRAQLEEKWNVHLEKSGEEKIINRRSNVTFRTKDNGAKKL